MNPNTLAVFAIAEIKAVIERFESGEDNAAETLAAIVDVCAAAQILPPAKRDAA